MKEKIIVTVGFIERSRILLCIPAYVIATKRAKIGKDGRIKLRIFLDETRYYKIINGSKCYIKKADYSNLMEDLVKFLKYCHISKFYIVSASNMTLNMTTFHHLDYISHRVMCDKSNYKYHYFDFLYRTAFVMSNNKRIYSNKLYLERFFGINYAG